MQSFTNSLHVYILKGFNENKWVSAFYSFSKTERNVCPLIKWFTIVHPVEMFHYNWVTEKKEIISFSRLFLLSWATIVRYNRVIHHCDLFISLLFLTNCTLISHLLSSTLYSESEQFKYDKIIMLLVKNRIDT